MSQNNSNIINSNGFTIVEIMIVAPIVILVIGIFISVIVNMTGEVLSTRSADTLAYNTQDSLNRIEQDVKLSNSFLATNSITLTSPQGYSDDSTIFHNASATTGTMLLLNAYTTTNNPSSATRNIVYFNSPNACNSAQVDQNAPISANIIYFVKNGTLWRRTIMPANYDTTGCDAINKISVVPWQRPSCAPAFTTPSNPFCKTQDIKLIDGVSSNNGFTISYFTSSDSTTANNTASDSGSSDTIRQTALQTTNTVSITINATGTTAGRDINYSGTIRVVLQNY